MASADETNGAADPSLSRKKLQERAPERAPPSEDAARRPVRARSQEPENSIRPRRLRARGAARAPRPAAQAERSEPRESAKPAQSSPSTASGKSDSDPWTVPAAVRDRFHQEGHRFYFRDGAVAFRDHGRKLTTPSENTEVVASLIEIARARGWAEIAVGGTDTFRAEAWRQGRLAGLTVRGYRASEEQRAELIRAIERRREEGPEARAIPQPTANALAEPGSTESRSRGAGKDLIAGRLIDHGREPYNFHPQEEMSYFVRLETPDGKRLIWGKDLRRALEKSLTQPKIGDEVALRRTGADSVTVKRRERDDTGKLLKETDLATHRNRWVIEKREFFQARESAARVVLDARVAPREAVKQHPELAGTYLNLHAAEIAARRLRDPEDQKKFVALVRGALADAVARGEPLQPVRLREPAPVKRTSREREDPVRP